MRARRAGRRTCCGSGWAVAVACALATPSATRSPTWRRTSSRAGIDGFAAGALLVMLVDSMIPDATRQAGRTTGLVTTLGFALAAGLSMT